MVLVSPLIQENVWLDKPKYDAAERRFYEKLSQSIASGKAVFPPSNSNSSPIAEISSDDNSLAIKEIRNQSLHIMSNHIISKPKEKEDYQPNHTPLCKKVNKTSFKSEEKELSPSAERNSNEQLNSNPSKSEKARSQAEASGLVCQKTKVDVEQSAKSISDTPISNNSSSTANIVNQDVNKLKGYFLQSKPLLPQPDTSLSKGTNVNTIPELSDLNPCLQSKMSLDVKRVNRLNKTATFDKQETTDLIIPTNITDIPNANENVPPDDERKKESKKKKRSKKERLRDKKGITQNTNSWNSLAGEVAKARQHIKNSLQCIDEIAVASNTVSIEVANRVVALEKENQDLINRMSKLEQKISALEKQLQATTAAAQKAASYPVPKKETAPKAPVAPTKLSNDDDDDDGVDLFASDSEEEDAEAAKIKEQRLAEYAAKKSKKPTLIAKSSIILDVKPWDDETDMKLLEQEVRKIEAVGLLWGASKLVPLAYGIHKLQINCVVEDEKISVDWLQETIQEIEDYVQSVDIAAFNKI